MAFAKGKPATLNDFNGLLPTGDYRKTMGDDEHCPPSSFEWIENNTTLKIGNANPVLFHTFNNKKTVDLSTKEMKCLATTINKITDTSKKNPQRTIHQLIENNCGPNKTKSDYTLVLSKEKGKTLIDLTMKFSKPSSKELQTVTCKYEK